MSTENIYKLRTVLQGHSSDVRDVKIAHQLPGALVTASRDKTAKLWYPQGDNSYTCKTTYKGHPKYVSVVLSLESSEEFPSGLILTGCQDGKIRAFLPDMEDPLYEMLGHTENVTSLYISKFGAIISGSWDKTARVWLNRKSTMTLTGHDLAVWCVSILPEVGIMVTGSADKTIRLWQTGKCVQILKGHTDAVRGLAVLSSQEFLSCANDASVRRWNVSGECLGTYFGHDNYIYSIALMPNGKDWVTSGEDRSVRVWQNNEVSQTIYLPAISVWSVVVLPNGDIAAATNDGNVRIFTNDPARQAPEDIQAAFEAELSQCTVAAQQELGGVKVSDLPGKETLFEPGRRDGQTKMVREDGGKVSVHSWSAAEQKWTKIGDVTGAAGGSQKTSGKKLYQGKEYDFVFDIEIDEPKSTLKLPFNLTDDPYMAAQQFIHKHDLSQYYLEEIANHIIKNTGGQTLGLGSGGNADPLTGGYSYSSNEASNSNPQAGMSADPFTGGSAYTSGSGGGDITLGSAAPPPDPWMQGAYRTDEMEVEETNPYFPLREFIKFDQPLKTEPLVNKLKEFNNQVEADQKLEESDLEKLPGLALEETEDLALGEKLMKVLAWPQSYIFPALDLVRLVIFHPNNNKLFLDNKDNMDKLFSLCLSFVNKESPAPNQMLSLKILTNLFSFSQGETLLRLYRESVVSRIFEKLFPVVDENKNIQIAAASLMLNYSVSIFNKLEDEAQVQVLSALCINFLTFISDWEARFRTLVALGTLLGSSTDAIEYAKTLETRDGVRGWKLLEGPPKVTSCAEFILKML